jgi:hypothetical protein
LSFQIGKKTKHIIAGNEGIVVKVHEAGEELKERDSRATKDQLFNLRPHNT